MTFGADTASEGAAAQPGRSTRGGVARAARLAHKELREILRDRRTIATLVLMPLLLYPILSMTLGTFLVSSLHPKPTTVYAVGFRSDEDLNLIAPYLLQGEKLLSRALRSNGAAGSQARGESRAGGAPSRLSTCIDDHLEESTAAGKWDLAVRIQRQGQRKTAEPIVCELIYREDSPDGAGALDYVERCLQEVNEHELRRRLWQLERLGLRLKGPGTASTCPTRAIRKPVESTAGPAFSVATLIPLILVLMTITGAVYPAIDLTAGERERGTLEILMAAPVPRMSLLLAKYAAVLTVSLLTATINVLAMTVTILATGLGPVLFGPSGLSATVVALVFGLMILFASFFSAVLLTVTSFARSFKEAQIYLIPLMLASLTPGVLSLMPGLKFSGILAVTPLVNVVLLARDMFEGAVDPVLALAAVLSTVFYTLAAVAAAARIFGGDAILLGSRGAWSDLFRRPSRSSPAPSVAAAMLCLALMFPAHFFLQNVLTHARGISLSAQLTAASLIAASVLGGVPLAVAAYCRVTIRDCCGLRRASLLAYPAAVLLGLSLWPFTYEIVLWSKTWGFTGLDSAHLRSAQNLAEELSSVPLAHLLACLAVAPAVLEECFFRGVLFAAFRHHIGVLAAVLLSSLAFGLFHVVAPTALALDRFAPSTLLGIALAWARHRTGSLFPSILLHALYNSLLLLVVYYRDQLPAGGWWMQPDVHLPWVLLVVAAAAAAVGAPLLRSARRLPTAGCERPREASP